MISAWKIYFKLAWFHKTPLVFLLDTKYKTIGRALLTGLAARIKASMGPRSYEPNFYDCDDFAWRFKAEASRLKENGVGFVIGFSGKTLHCWNDAMCRFGTLQIEPQTGRIFVKDRKYRAVVVII